MDFGTRLRLLRLKRGKSLRDCATFLGVSPSFVCLVEAGKRVPNAFLLGKWMAFLAAGQQLRGQATAFVAQKKLAPNARMTIGEAADVLRNLLNEKLTGNADIPGQDATASQDARAVLQAMDEDPAFREHVLHLARLPANRRALTLNTWSALERVFSAGSGSQRGR